MNLNGEGEKKEITIPPTPTNFVTKLYIFMPSLYKQIRKYKYFSSKKGSVLKGFLRSYSAGGGGMFSGAY